MKIKPQIYAQLLVESLKNKADFAAIAENLWHILQKNKQYRDLPKILELIDQEYARQENSVLAKVYSEKALSAEEIEEIKNKLKKYSSSPREARVERFSTSSNNKVVIKNIINKNYGGITLKVDDKIIDLSVIGKIEKLKTKLIQN